MKNVRFFIIFFICCMLFTACSGFSSALSEQSAGFTYAPAALTAFPVSDDPSKEPLSYNTDVPSQTAPKLSAYPYGVFIGLNPEDIQRLAGYETVVIDAAYYTPEDIEKMHQSGQTVYSYLNIGSVESFRDYYEKYEPLTLGVYEDWPDERWVDVSKPEWQAFVIETMAASLAEKHIDGFFLDNADVYYVYPRKNIYQGLLSILSGLGKYGLPLIINGGDTFVKAIIENNGDTAGLISGVNQECVFTSIDFDNNTFGLQDEENHTYYSEYIELCKRQGIKVYITEYAAHSKDLEQKISAYCNENGFMYYISSSLELDRAKQHN